MRVLLVHNPSAGKGDHPKEELLAILSLAGHKVAYCSTKSDDFPRMLKEPAELIAIAGGDGTVRKVVTKLERRSTPLALIPVGTANNVARSLGLENGDRRQTVASWEQLGAARVYLGSVEGVGEPRPFIEAVGIGALAETTSDKAPHGLDGEKRLLFGRHMLRERIEKAEPLDVAVEVDGRAVVGSWLFVEVVNNRYTGPALPLCPCAHPGDGTLAVVALAEERRDEMMAWLGAPEASDPPLHVEVGAKVRFRWSGRPVLRIDDQVAEIPKGREAIDIGLQDVPLTVLLPREATFSRPASAAGRKPQEVA